jgi:hypothetical protein
MIITVEWCCFDPVLLLLLLLLLPAFEVSCCVLHRRSAAR